MILRRGQHTVLAPWEDFGTPEGHWLEPGETVEMGLRFRFEPNPKESRG